MSDERKAKAVSCPAVMAGEEPVFRITGLSKTYGRGEQAVRALSDLDLEVHKGEIFGIIGLSGAGKSTLVRCMNLLEKPTEGSVLFRGRDLTAMRSAELRETRRSIGMIFQGFNLLMQRTVIRNVCFPLEIAGMNKKDAVIRAKELLETVELADKADAYPAQLSGGQKQRVAIARALASKPDVLLCDEATSALDPSTTNSILALLKEINRKLGVTLVMITHQMSVIEAICDRVAIMEQSRIVEEGSVQAIFRAPKTETARKLIFPQGQPDMSDFPRGGHCLRIVFDGSSSYEPVLSGMVLSCNAPVNILFADTKDIGGKAFGQMLIQLPEKENDAARMCEYLHQHNISYTEEARENV